VSAARAVSGSAGGSKSRPKAKQVASDLLSDCSDVAEANAKRSFAEGFTNVKPQTETDTQQPSVAAASESRLSVTQRSKRITDAYAEAEPMCKWPAVNSVVIRAIKAEEWTDGEIQAALLRMAEENRSVTVDSLRIELNGLPPLPGGRVATTDQRVADAQSLKARMRQGTADPLPPNTIQGSVIR